MGRPLWVGGTIVQGQATQVRAEEQSKSYSFASNSSRQPVAECVWMCEREEGRSENGWASSGTPYREGWTGLYSP